LASCTLKEEGASRWNCASTQTLHCCGTTVRGWTAAMGVAAT
jgi:hypothetical protein